MSFTTVRLILEALAAARRPEGRLPVSDRGTLGGLITIRYHNSGLPAQPLACKPLILKTRRDVRVVEGARLESVCRELYRGFESLSLRQL